METKDLFELIYGLIWGIGLIFSFRRVKQEPKIWPRFFGVSGAVFIFTLFTIESVMGWINTGFLQYIIASFFLTTTVGVVSYLGGRRLAKRYEEYYERDRDSK